MFNTKNGYVYEKFLQAEWGCLDPQLQDDNNHVDKKKVKAYVGKLQKNCLKVLSGKKKNLDGQFWVDSFVLGCFQQYAMEKLNTNIIIVDEHNERLNFYEADFLYNGDIVFMSFDNAHYDAYRGAKGNRAFAFSEVPFVLAERITIVLSNGI
eukprot:Awhi_evm1s6440